MPYPYWAAALIFAWTSNFAISAPADPPIRIGYDDLCPYSCLKGGEQGYFVDAVEEILKANGFTVVAVKGSWVRLKMLAQKGELELVVPLTRFESEELKFDRNTLPLGRIEGMLFTHKTSTWQYKDEDSLKGQSLCIIRDYGYPPVITALMEDPEQSKNILTLTSDQGTDQQVKMLSKQRVAIVPSDRNAFLFHARRQGLEDKIRIAGTLPMDALYTDLHVGISARSPELRKKIKQVLDKGIADFQKNGRLDQLKAKYGVN